MKHILFVLLFMLAVPSVAQDNEPITQENCIDQLQLQRDTPEVLDQIDFIRELLNQSDTEPVPLEPRELETLLFYANSDLTLDETMIVIGEAYDTFVEVPAEIVETLLDQGDALDTVSIPECNYIMYHGDITVSCEGDGAFTATQPTGNPPQPIQLTNRGDWLVLNAGQGIVFNLVPFEEGETYVGQLERPEVTFHYVVYETENGYEGTIQQIIPDDVCPGFLVISNFVLQEFDNQDDGIPEIQQEEFVDMTDIWGE